MLVEEEFPLAALFVVIDIPKFIGAMEACLSHASPFAMVT